MAQVRVPFSYVQQVQSPAQSILQGYQSGLQMQDRRRQLAMQEQAMLAQQQAQAQNEQFRQAFQEFATKPMKSVSDYTSLIAMAPKEMVSSVQSVYNAMGEEAEKVERRQAAELISAFKMDPDRGKEILDTRIEAAKNAGNMEEVQALQAYRKIADVDPDAVVEAVALQSGMAFGDEFLKQIPGLSEKRVQGQKVLDDGTTVIVYTDGATEVRNPEGVVLEGEARAQAIRDAQQYGIDIQRERSGAREIGKFNIKEGQRALEASRGFAKQIPKLQRARKLIVEEGATTGAWKNRLPTFEDATLELQQIQKDLGLDVVGSVTFGALSEEELKLALQVALPTDLSGPELVDFIDRKLDAMNKYKVESEKLARYLLAGGNFADYVAQYSEPSGQTDRFAGFEIVEE